MVPNRLSKVERKPANIFDQYVGIVGIDMASFLTNKLPTLQNVRLFVFDFLTLRNVGQHVGYTQRKPINMLPRCGNVGQHLSNIQIPALTF